MRGPTNLANNKFNWRKNTNNLAKALATGEDLKISNNTKKKKTFCQEGIKFVFKVPKVQIRKKGSLPASLFKVFKAH